MREFQRTYYFEPADAETSPYSLGNGTWGPMTMTPGGTRNFVFITGTEEQLSRGFFVVTWRVQGRPPKTTDITRYVRDAGVDEAADQSAASR